MYGLDFSICISRPHSTESEQTADTNSSARKASKVENKCTSEVPAVEVPGLDVDVSINGILKFSVPWRGLTSRGGGSMGGSCSSMRTGNFFFLVEDVSLDEIVNADVCLTFDSAGDSGDYSRDAIDCDESMSMEIVNRPSYRKLQPPLATANDRELYGKFKGFICSAYCQSARIPMSSCYFFEYKIGIYDFYDDRNLESPLKASSKPSREVDTTRISNTNANACANKSVLSPRLESKANVDDDFSVLSLSFGISSSSPISSTFPASPTHSLQVIDNNNNNKKNNNNNNKNNNNNNNNNNSNNSNNNNNNNNGNENCSMSNNNSFDEGFDDVLLSDVYDMIYNVKRLPLMDLSPPDLYREVGSQVGSCAITSDIMQRGGGRDDTYDFIKPRQSLKCLIAQSSKARGCKDSEAVNLKISAGIKAAATGNGGRSHPPPSKTPPRMKLQPHTFVPGPTISSSAPRYPASSVNVDAITSPTESSRGARDRPSLHAFHPPAHDIEAPLFSKINMVASEDLPIHRTSSQGRVDSTTAQYVAIPAASASRSVSEPESESPPGRCTDAISYGISNSNSYDNSYSSSSSIGLRCKPLVAHLFTEYSSEKVVLYKWN